MHLTLHQTAQRLYVVRQGLAEDGSDELRVLKFDRTSVALDVTEDPTPYTQPQFKRLLAAIHAGNQQHGGLQLVCEACALLGVVQLLEGPYLLLVTRRRYLGAICGHKIYGVDATALLPILSPAAHCAAFGTNYPSTAEQRYRKLLAGVQLTKDFFFSYSWPIHQTAQRIFEEATAGSPGSAESAQGSPATDPCATKFVWNEFLSRPLREALGNAHWVVSLAHGSFQQRPLALLGRGLTLTLVARRSRQFAGTRYLKRGVTDQGYCANEVEVEQLVEAGRNWRSGQPLLSSVVQVRGSIPLHWAQEPGSSVLKPEIILNRFDPLYTATRRHLDQLREQYGEPVCVLDLVKRVERRPRESVLGCEYATAVRFLNQRLAPSQQRVQYQAYDLSHRARTVRTALLADLQRLQEPVLAAVGVFVSVEGGGGGPAGGAGRRQRGVLRTNCIDSLDRTNVGQFSYGMLALGQQLHALGIAESAWLDPGSGLARQLMDLYECMGHTLALQYGGSEAHSSFFQRQRGTWEATTQSRDLLTAVRRFYSNAYTDAEKQDAVNLFLGVFQPALGRPHLWELGGDSYLHTARGRTPFRTQAVGSRAASSSSAAVQPARTPAPAVAAEGNPALASLPTPQFPAPAQHAGHARPLSPPPEPEDAGLQESLSAVSLVSLSSDGSFAPTLSSLVEGASCPLPPLLPTNPERQTAPAPADSQPSTPRNSMISATRSASAPAEATAAHPESSPPTALLPPAGRLARRSPLLGASRKPAKLESFDKLLARQPVAHVRLTAPAPPAKQPARGWLSPSKAAPLPPVPSQQHRSAVSRSSSVGADVAVSGPGVPIPRGSLQRSNSDPSLASSLSLPSLHVEAAAAAARPRRVTFDGATVLGAAANTSGLLSQRTAPAGTLAQLTERAAAGGTGAFVFLEPAPDARSGYGGGMRRNVSYHTLAGLNLEGAAAAEASIKQSSAAGPPLSLPTLTKPSRRLSFPSFARLRALTRRGSLTSVNEMAASTDIAGGASALPRPSPSLLAPRPTGGAASGLPAGAPEPLSMSAVVYGAEAVRRGLDSLGVAPSAAAWWLSGADPLALMMEERARLREQIARQHEALATPLDPVEHRRLVEEAAAAMRPAWALSLGSFAQGNSTLPAPSTTHVV